MSDITRKYTVEEIYPDEAEGDIAIQTFSSNHLERTFVFVLDCLSSNESSINISCFRIDYAERVYLENFKAACEWYMRELKSEHL